MNIFEESATIVEQTWQFMYGLLMYNHVYYVKYQYEPVQMSHDVKRT